jgi:aminoglycoside phosphotransferase
VSPAGGPHQRAARLLPAGWEVVTLGCSGDGVARSRDGRHHAKASTDVARLRDERDRTAWLATTAVPVPAIADWTESTAGAVVITTTLPGAPASAVPAADAPLAATAAGTLLALLHELPAAACPFDRRLAVTVPLARTAVATGSVDVDDLDAERLGRSPASLLSELETAARAHPEVAQDVVVCHGDASLPNLFLDPRTGEPTGVLDVGRLGLADRHLDLALVLRSMRDGRNPQYGAAREPAFWRGYGLRAATDVDEHRLALYRLLDEFF